jgi:hypothetical protein
MGEKKVFGRDWNHDAPKPAARHGVASGHFRWVLAAISAHGIYHGTTDLQENKPLNIKDKKGLLIIEWE